MFLRCIHKMVYKPHANRFRSGSEETVSSLLTAAGYYYEYEPYYIKYEVHEVRKYLPDIVLDNNIILEVKGRFFPVDRKKHIRLRENHPNIDVRFVFDNPNARLSKGAKSSYADWCEKNSFKYCGKKDVNVILGWVNELQKTGDIPHTTIRRTLPRSTKKV